MTATEYQVMDEEAEAARQRIRVLHVAFMLAIGVYVLVAVLMQAFDARPEGADLNLWLMRGLLAAAGIMGLAAGERIPLKRPSTLDGRSDWMARLSPAKWQVATRAILRMAFTEALGIFGLLLFLIGGSVVDVLVFCGVALVIFGVRFPTRERWAREVAGAERALVLGA